LWFGGAFTIGLVGSLPFLFFRSSQMCMSFKGTSNTKQRQCIQKKKEKKKEEEEETEKK